MPAAPDPKVADAAPTDGILTGCDEQHRVADLCRLDAAKAGADWQCVVKPVLRGCDGQAA
jgi:hypothetical protein